VGITGMTLHPLLYLTFRVNDDSEWRDETLTCPEYAEDLLLRLLSVPMYLGD
jgi:hypothetical protein